MRVDKYCKQCGKRFTINYKPSRKYPGKFCSRQCFYDSTRVERQCPNCGKTFLKAQSRTKHRKDVYCSRCCYETHRARNRTELVCPVCKKDFICYGDTKRICCSNKCSRKRTGEERHCKRCGKEFHVELKRVALDGLGQYCSRECFYLEHRITKPCKHCGKPFTEMISRHFDYCSISCVGRAREKGPRIDQYGMRMVITEDWYSSESAHIGRKHRGEHRILVEAAIGRKLEYCGEQIIHLNGINSDNRLRNLYVCTGISEFQRIRQGSLPFPKKSNVDDLKIKQKGD